MKRISLTAVLLFVSFLLRADREIGVSVSSSAFVVDGKLREYAYVGYDWSAPFIVFDRENTVTNGLFEPVGKPYSDLRTQCGVFTDGTNLCLSVRAPCSSSHCPPNRQDRIGISVSPDGRNILIVECDISGRCSVSRIGTEGSRVPLKPSGVKAGVNLWKSARMFETEIVIPFSVIGMEPKAAGDSWHFNAYRKGPSCGGVSSWSPVQGDMFNLDRFGRIVFGARKNRNKVVLPENKGKNVFLWLGERWGGIYLSKPPLDENEIDKVMLSGIRGGRAVGHFRISNLTDRPALYSLKTDEFKKNEFAKHIRFREVGDLELKGGPIVSDPIFNLPNGSVLRIPSKSTVMVWVDVNLETFKPGVYKALLRLIPGYSKFEEKHIELNLTVGKVDVRKVNMPTWTYSTRWARDIRELKDYRFNVINMIEFQFGPKPRPDGSRDWSLFDDAVNAMVENGIPLGEIRLLFYHIFPRWANPRDRPKDVVRVVESVQAGIEHARERYGIGLDRIWFSTVDEPHGDPDDPKSDASHAFYGVRLAKQINQRLKSWTNPYKSGEMKYLPRYLKEFDVLVPFLPFINNDDASASRQYARSGKDIWSYTIYLKQNRPVQYRSISWKNFEYGFDGPAGFYTLFHSSGDMFNSYDEKGAPDYGAVYRDVRTECASPSLRLEAWYQGHLEQRLLMWCRERISEMADRQKAECCRNRLNGLVKRATAPRTNFDLISQELLDFSDGLAK